MMNEQHPATNAETSWVSIELCTSAMKAAAQSEDWEQVLNLASDRHEKLRRHFEQFPVSSDSADFYQRRLTGLLHGEKNLQHLASNARRAAMQDGLASNKNHRAMAAYLKS